MYDTLIRLGHVLFRYRGAIAVPFFIFLVLLGQAPRYKSIPYIFILCGETLRIWAAGYIGKTARAASFETKYRIANGPFKYLKHPLYMGNFLLVIGVVLLFNPPLPYAIFLIMFFVIEYSIIIVGEMHHLRTTARKDRRFSIRNAACEGSTLLVIIVIILIHLFVDRMVDMPILSSVQ